MKSAKLKKNPCGLFKPAGVLILRSTNLLSHTLTSTLPSALEGLTTVFGMGTGVSPPEKVLQI